MPDRFRWIAAGDTDGTGAMRPSGSGDARRLTSKRLLAWVSSRTQLAARLWRPTFYFFQMAERKFFARVAQDKGLMPAVIATLPSARRATIRKRFPK